MDILFFDYIELINLNFYKIVFKPIVCDDFFSNIIASLIRQSLFINTFGYSVTEISISNVNSEYGYLFGLEEDILNLILNIKGLIFKLKNVKKVFLKLSTSNKIVKGSDIKLNKYTKLINPDHVICHLNNNLNLDLIIKVEKGRGYIPYNSDKKYRSNSDLKNGILINTYFCPILRVSYLVEKINDSLYDNLKRFIFFVETNGSSNAKTAIINAINSFLHIFWNFKLSKNKFKNNIFSSNQNSVIFLSILDLGLSFRTVKFLNSFGIFKLNDLIKCTKFDLLNYSVFSKKTLKEVKKILKYYNFSLFS